jgi:hypothetical protein
VEEMMAMAGHTWTGVYSIYWKIPHPQSTTGGRRVISADSAGGGGDVKRVKRKLKETRGKMVKFKLKGEYRCKRGQLNSKKV